MCGASVAHAARRVKGGVYMRRRSLFRTSVRSSQFARDQSLESSRVSESTVMAPVLVKRVLISESVDACCKTILQENGIEVTEKQQMTKEELIAEIQVSDSEVVQQLHRNIKWLDLNRRQANGVFQCSNSTNVMSNISM